MKYFDKHRDGYLKQFRERYAKAVDAMLKLTEIPYTKEELQETIDKNRKFIIKHYGEYRSKK